MISKYKGKTAKIQSLGDKFRRLGDNEWFFVFWPVELSTIQKYELEKELNLLNNRISEINEAEIQRLFGPLMENYELVNFDLDTHSKIKIGEGKKAKRNCRFCRKSEPEVSFKKEAHAISEALGNKKLIINEECDDCNELFDKKIERDFIYYHDLVRTMFGIKNKDNVVPKMKGKGFEFFKSDMGNLSIAIMESREHGQQAIPDSVNFDTGRKIKLQNIYKALCKFALSLIDSKHINHFGETIKWLRDEKDAPRLPKVAVLHNHLSLVKRPELTLHVRNNKNYKVPHLVGEFKFTFYVYIFIVPLSTNDSRNFLNDDEYDEFLNCFLHVRNTNGFNFKDFSQNIERELNFKISFEQNEIASIKAAPPPPISITLMQLLTRDTCFMSVFRYFHLNIGWELIKPLKGNFIKS